MFGSEPEDGDIIEMSPGESRFARFARFGQPGRLARLPRVGRRGRLALLVPVACAVLVAGAVVAVVRINPPTPLNSALARLITQVTTVPVNAGAPGNINSDSWASSSGGASSALVTSLSFDFAPTSVSGPPLTVGGKPEVLYVAAEYCSYCAAENWSLIVALSRFGSFSGLSTSRSPHFDQIPPVDGWTFYGSSYTSRYLAFVPVEIYSNVLASRRADPNDPKSYRSLQPLTPAEQAVFSRYDDQRLTPFFDFGGRVTVIGGDVVPNYLVGLSWSRIAVGLRHPATPAAATILTGADLLTSEFCTLTGDRPAAACPTWAR
jgi:hypothetical protein